MDPNRMQNGRPTHEKVRKTMIPHEFTDWGLELRV